MIVKLDMEKAYDKLNCNFLLKVCREFRFCNQWITWIKELIRDNPISLLLGGSSTEFFISSQGLLLGDPLSPTFFIIVEEVLSRGITNLLRTNKMIPYYVHRKAPPHLPCFIC